MKQRAVLPGQVMRVEKCPAAVTSAEPALRPGRPVAPAHSLRRADPGTCDPAGPRMPRTFRKKD